MGGLAVWRVQTRSVEVTVVKLGEGRTHDIFEMRVRERRRGERREGRSRGKYNHGMAAMGKVE